MQKFCGMVGVLFSLLCGFHAEATTVAKRPSAPPLRLQSTILEMSACRQVILVTTPNAGMTMMQRFGCINGAPAEQRLGNHCITFRPSLASADLAGESGFIGTGEQGEPRKREGDLRTPAGVFRLIAVFGIATPAQVASLRLPYRQVTATTEAIDDPRSRYYNQVVDRAAIAHPDWSSAESMLQVGDRYRFGITIAHNPQPFAGYGSCIFLHVWDHHFSGTTGCTAIELEYTGKHCTPYLPISTTPENISPPKNNLLPLKRPIARMLNQSVSHGIQMDINPL
jgi:hypothetical protein